MVAVEPPPLHSSRKTVLINVSADGKARIDKEMHRVLAVTLYKRKREINQERANRKTAAVMMQRG